MFNFFSLNIFFFKINIFEKIKKILGKHLFFFKMKKIDFLKSVKEVIIFNKKNLKSSWKFYKPFKVWYFDWIKYRILVNINFYKQVNKYLFIKGTFFFNKFYFFSIFLKNKVRFLKNKVKFSFFKKKVMSSLFFKKKFYNQFKKKNKYSLKLLKRKNYKITSFKNIFKFPRLHKKSKYLFLKNIFLKKLTKNGSLHSFQKYNFLKAINKGVFFYTDNKVNLFSKGVTKPEFSLKKLNINKITDHVLFYNNYYYFLQFFKVFKYQYSLNALNYRLIDWRIKF